MTEDFDPSSEDQSYSYGNDDRSKKEAMILTLLFVGVVGLSFALVGLDIGVQPPAQAQEEQGETESEHGEDAADVVDGEALARAGAIPPGDLVAQASEELLQEILALELDPDFVPADGAPEDEKKDPTLEDAAPGEGENKGTADPYSDLVMVGDDETPVRNANGDRVKLATPKTQAPTAPRSRLPPPPPDQESAERAAKPTPKDEREARVAPAPSPAPAPEPSPAPAEKTEPATGGDLKSVLRTAKKKLSSRDYSGAVNDYKRALSLKGGSRARLGLARAYQELGKNVQAKAELKRVLTANPRSAGARLLMGSILQEEGNRTAARAHYQKFLDAHPNHARAERIRGIMRGL